jgi:hypothetical protein
VGAGVKPGKYDDIQMIDVAPTLASLLQANLPASGQGDVLVEMLDLPESVRDDLPGYLEAQQSQLLQAYQAAIGYSVAPQEGDDVVATHQAALEVARQKRLNAERLPRFILALAAAILPLIWLLRKSRKELGWLVGASLVYIGLFNLRYAVLDGRTYSLSSVASANDLILYSAATTLLSLLISWSIFTLGGKIFQRSPGQASLLTLDLSLTTIYLLALPLLVSFVLNGALVTWTLPDFLSMFLGFLSTIQILMVSIFGIVLAGLTALVTKLRKPAAI